MMRLLLTFILIMIFGNSYSQKVAVTYYNNQWELTNKEFAHYFRVGYIDTIKYQYYGEVKDYYKNGNLQMKGNFYANSKIDTFYFYYPNGNLMMKGNYQNNVRYGIWTSYHENGRFKDRVAFNGDFLCPLKFMDEFKTDSLINGTGGWETEFINGLDRVSIKLKARYKDTLRHGTWTYHSKSILPGAEAGPKLLCSEEYEMGKFLKGKYYWNGGGIEDLRSPVIKILPELGKFANLEKWSATKYASKEEYPFLKFLPEVDSTLFPVDKLAEFPGGLEAFEKILREQIKIPKSFYSNEGNSSCTYELVVTEEGRIKIRRKPSPSLELISPDIYYLGLDVMKILKKLPDWTPAIRDNKKVKNYFTMLIRQSQGRVMFQLFSHNEINKP